MAKRSAYKRKKKWRQQRRQRRIQNLCDYYLADTKGRSHINLLHEEEKGNFPKNIIGSVKCPVCSRKDVLVSNQKGLRGSPVEDYLVSHKQNRSTYICEGSGKKLHDLSLKK